MSLSVTMQGGRELSRTHTEQPEAHSLLSRGLITYCLLAITYYLLASHQKEWTAHVAALLTALTRDALRLPDDVPHRADHGAAAPRGPLGDRGLHGGRSPHGLLQLARHRAARRAISTMAAVGHRMGGVVGHTARGVADVRVWAGPDPPGKWRGAWLVGGSSAVDGQRRTGDKGRFVAGRTPSQLSVLTPQHRLPLCYRWQGRQSDRPRHGYSLG